MAEFGAAQPGWRSETPNMQPLTPLTSYMTSRLQSALMCSWLQQAYLWHIRDWVICHRLRREDGLTVLYAAPRFITRI